MSIHLYIQTLLDLTFFSVKIAPHAPDFRSHQLLLPLKQPEITI